MTNVLLTTMAAAAGTPAGEKLYNGIILPSPWPPQIPPVTLESLVPPYLMAPPDVIPIDVGRQLFVDDFLIEATTLQRTCYAAEYYPNNPVLKPDRAWEHEGLLNYGTKAPTAMVFSDGVWYDPQDHLFKMWYMGGYMHSTCYATSKDGIHWEKPSQDVKQGTNIVQPGKRDSSIVWLDLEEGDPQRRYKMFRAHSDGGWAFSIHFSPDGIHWSDEIARSGPCRDRSTVFYNPFRKVWVYSLRAASPGLGRPVPGRCRRYWENPDLLAGAKWDCPCIRFMKLNMDLTRLNYWVGADRLDPRRPDLDVQPQLYNLDAVAYESVMLGLFTIWPGQPEDRPKPNYVAVGFSRDGFHWHRPSHDAFIPVSERFGDWNWGNVQSAGGCCLIAGDKLYFYVSGRAGLAGSSNSGVCSTGLAILRRDGFASVDAGSESGQLATRPVRFSGKYMFVNVDSSEGGLQVEVLDSQNKAISPFSQDNCIPIKVDKTLQAVQWQGIGDLSQLAGRAVKFRFHLTNGRLYSFWVSPTPNGASHGYVAAGGPGFGGHVDTVGVDGE